MSAATVNGRANGQANGQAKAAPARRLLDLPLAKLGLDSRCQCRVELDEEYADRMAAFLREKDAQGNPRQLPPGVAFHEGGRYLLADGHHTREGHRRAGRKTMTVWVHEGGAREAVLYSVSCNLRHGKQLAAEDREKGARTLLGDEEWGKWSDSEIARRSGCGRGKVAELRQGLRREREGSLAGSESEPPRTYTTRHGTTATMRTGRVGSAGRNQHTEAPAPATAPAAPGPTADQVRAEYGRNRPRWVREAQEGLERARRALVCLTLGGSEAAYLPALRAVEDLLAAGPLAAEGGADGG